MRPSPEIEHADETRGAPVGPRSRWTDRIGFVLGNQSVLIGAVIVSVIVAAALLAPVLPLADPNRTQPGRRLAAPLSAGLLLGSDHLGRDLLSRIVWGSRISLTVGVLATGLAMIAGTTVGIVAGYFGGLVDQVVMRAIDHQSSMGAWVGETTKQGKVGIMKNWTYEDGRKYMFSEAEVKAARKE